jgi:hypothetical protein
MNSSNKNPGTETFDRVQKWAFPVIIVAAAILAVWRNDLSFALLPLALLVAAIYLAIVVSGSRIIRAIGLKRLQRR